LAGRSEFRQGLIVDGKQQKQQLVSGGRDDCISDAAAMMMNSDHKFAWVFFGDDRSFNRARQYVEFCTPGRRLVDVSKTMTNTPGGVAFALINSSGRFLLQMTYDQPKLYHCAFYDGDFECVKDGRLYRGVLKDNQASTAVHLAEGFDRVDKHAARAFFAAPYAIDIIISRVYKLPVAEQAPKAILVADGRAALATSADARPHHAPLRPSFGSGVRRGDVPVVKYQQRGLDVCVAYSVASALAYGGVVDAVGCAFDEKIARLFDAAAPLRRVNVVTDFINDHVVGVSVRRLKCPQVSDLLKPSPYPTILALQDSGGSSNHVVTIVGNWIFDANHELAIPLSTEGFDECCLDDTTLVRVVKVVQVYPSGHKTLAQWRTAMHFELSALLADVTR
jgi:hypothetical protein